MVEWQKQDNILLVLISEYQITVLFLPGSIDFLSEGQQSSRSHAQPQTFPLKFDSANKAEWVGAVY